MRRGLTILLTAVVVTGGARPTLAQKRVVVERPRPAVLPARPESAVVPAATLAPPHEAGDRRSVAPRFRHLTGSASVLSRLDDNVNRDDAGLTSVGVITGLAARFESGASRPWLVLEYDVAAHRYSATERFNRVSQRGRATFAARLQRWWTVDMVTEGSLKGSSEDRDVSDQLGVLPRSEFRLGEASRLRLVGAQRWRRYPTDALQDATNRYAALEFRHRFADGATFETEARVEQNAARGPRFDYRRTTYASAYATPLGTRAVLEVEMQYRIQAYQGRVVEIHDVDYPRRDQRFEPAATLQGRVAGGDLELALEPEWRRSNDPDKGFDQHVLVFGMRRRW